MVYLMGMFNILLILLLSMENYGKYGGIWMFFRKLIMI